jgi:hypothetical protein
MAAKKLPHYPRVTKRKTPATKSSPRAPLNILDAPQAGLGDRRADVHLAAQWHKALGVCGTCYSKIVTAAQKHSRQARPAGHSAELGFMDTVRLAREALAPSTAVLRRDSEAQVNVNRRSHQRGELCT